MPKTGAVRRRSYDQFCAMARGLDVLGDRWTLLLIRDLLLGPKRYKDLLDGLPGIGTNLLADRLRELEGLGVIERATLPPPAGSTVYQLTESGQAIEPIMIALGRWGARFLAGGPRKTDVMVPRAYFVAMRGTFDPEAAAGLRSTYELRVDGLVFEVSIRDGRITTREAQPSQPDAVFTMDVQTLNALLFQMLTPTDAIASGRAQVDGKPGALEQFIGVFGFHGAVPAGAGRSIRPAGKPARSRRG
jgi:DNA-binding HxlR family transcriptional regulator/putative sterol carrier protein